MFSDVGNVFFYVFVRAPPGPIPAGYPGGPRGGPDPRRAAREPREGPRGGPEPRRAPGGPRGEHRAQARAQGRAHQGPGPDAPEAHAQSFLPIAFEGRG